MEKIKEVEEIGKEIVSLFNLKRIKGKKEPMFNTSYGAKSYLGIGRTVNGILNDLNN